MIKATSISKNRSKFIIYILNKFDKVIAKYEEKWVNKYIKRLLKKVRYLFKSGM